MRELSVEQKLRYRDLMLQVKRFLRYAPRGTSGEVLNREARRFHDRLSTFYEYDKNGVRKLQERLRNLAEMKRAD